MALLVRPIRQGSVRVVGIDGSEDTVRVRPPALDVATEVRVIDSVEIDICELRDSIRVCGPPGILRVYILEVAVRHILRAAATEEDVLDVRILDLTFEAKKAALEAIFEGMVVDDRLVVADAERIGVRRLVIGDPPADAVHIV